MHPTDFPGPAAAAPPRPRLAIAACAAVFAAGLALYARTLGYPFLNWDDPAYVVENEWVQGLSLANLRAIFTSGILGGWLPVHLLSYAFDHALWGLDPFGYHLHSLLLNAANGALALWVLLQITQRPAAALLAALFFTVHPSHVSSVAWISARKELLFTAFLLLSTGAYLRARRDAVFDRRAYAASLVLFALGALSKTTIGLYPLFFLLLDRVLDARLAPERRRAFAFHVKTKLPYLAVAAAVIAVNLQTQVVAEHPYAQSLYSYALVKGQAGWRYLWVLLGLLPGQPLYDTPPIRVDAIGAALTLAPLAIAPLAFLFAWRRRHHESALALAWLILGLTPAIVFPLVTFMADRYLYAPSLGFCWLLGIGIDALGSRMRSPAWKAGLVVVLLLLVWGRLFPVTWMYLPVWRSSESLWTYAMAHATDSRARSGLAAVWIDQERFDEVRELLSGVELDAMGSVNRGMAHFKLGRLHDALEDTDQAQRKLGDEPAPRIAGTLYALRGRILWKLGRKQEAVEAWQEALRLAPGHGDARELIDTLARPEGLAGS